MILKNGKKKLTEIKKLYTDFKNLYFFLNRNSKTPI